LPQQQQQKQQQIFDKNSSHTSRQH